MPTGFDWKPVLGLVRHAVAAMATGAAAWGYTVSGDDAEIIAGAAVALLMAGWSFAQKKGWAP